MRPVFLAVLSLLLVLAAAPPCPADAPAIRADVVYGHKDGMALTFDVLTPERPNGAAVLHLQSGGWYSTWRPPEHLVGAERPLLDVGYTVFIVRHGSAPKYTVPEAVADVQRCVRYIRLHAEEFKVDPDRLGVTGGSAGGHLTLMLATTGDDGDPQADDPVLKTSSRIACGVSLYPPTDLRGWTTDPPDAIKAHAGLKPPLAFPAEKEASVSPIVAVTADDAPVLMIHGDKDELVPIAHSLNILPKFKEAGAVGELLTIEGAGHGYNPEQNREQVLPAMLKWFETYLQPQAKAAQGPISRDRLVALCIVPADVN
ncbi:MAG: alpha/beta hydrolase [Planctomycetaceae bacterium]|nr:alpha/beta hydrolase [Planctomycetaceae bacterium]